MKTLSALLIAVVALTAAAAATAAPKKPPVVVAVIDTGVTPVKGVAGRLVPGYDFVDNDTDPTDMFGHGTEIAGIVLKTCHGCVVMPVRSLGAGIGSDTDVISGIQYAVQNHANIINLSLFSQSDDPDLDAAIEAAYHAGVTVVVAAGNDGLSTGYPAESAVDSIAVGSLDPASRARFLWSNYGPWVDVWGPGLFTVTNMFGKPVGVAGTSATTGYVSGMAANAIQAGASSPDMVLAMLKAKLPQVLN